jgi:hypothetical protein
MTIALSRSYAGIAAGSVVKLSTALEASLIAQGFAATSAAALTTGAQTMNLNAGTVAIAAGSSSVVVTNSLVDANTKIYAVVEQATADGTLLRVERVVPAAGSFTIYGTANATATTQISWCILVQGGETNLNP